MTWNLMWATPKSWRAEPIKRRINATQADVMCLTEALTDFLECDYCISSDPDYGYVQKGNRRKVLLCSQTPWQDVDTIGDAALPSGRFVSGVTQGIRFVGVCIPWKDAHVRTGRKDREPWQDHLTYCSALKKVLTGYRSHPEPICVFGDFNQRIPRQGQPERAYGTLRDSLSDDMTVVTKGIEDAEGKPLIDHVVVSAHLNAKVDTIISNKSDTGRLLSDHVGVVATLND